MSSIVKRRKPKARIQIGDEATVELLFLRVFVKLRFFLLWRDRLVRWFLEVVYRQGMQHEEIGINRDQTCRRAVFLAVLQDRVHVLWILSGLHGDLRIC